MMNHSFSNMTLKGSTNPCAGRLPVCKTEKSPAVKVKIKSSDNCFFFIIGIVHMDWVSEDQTINQFYHWEMLITP